MTAIEINGLDSLIGIPDEEIGETLNKFVNIRNIRLLNCRINDTVLDKLCCRFGEQLSVLDISGNSCRLVDNLEHIVKLVNLTQLKINWTSISDEILLAICLNMPKLQCLVIPNCVITEEGLSHLKNLCSLTELDISNNSIKDQGLSYLQNITNLISLNVSGNETMTDVGVKHLSSLKSLTHLNMSSTNITDDGLVYVLELTRLQKLHLDSCNKITDDGILLYISQLTELKKVSHTLI